MDEKNVKCIHIIFPDLQAQGRLVIPHRKFHILNLPGRKPASRMSGRCAFVAAAHAENRFPQIADVIYISLQKTLPRMGTVGIAEADVDCYRHPVFQRLFNHIVDPHHQLRRPGKAVRPRTPQLYHAVIARGNGQNAGSMPAHVPAHRQRVLPRQHFTRRLTDSSLLHQPFIRRLPNCFLLRQPLPRQRFIELLLRILRSHIVSGRRRPLRRLIPQGADPRGPVQVPELRMAVIRPGIQHRHQHPSSCERQGRTLHRRHAGGPLSVCSCKIKALRLLDIFDLRNIRQPPDQRLRHHQDGVFIQKPGHLNIFGGDPLQVSRIFDDQLPGPLLPVIAGI